MSDPSHRSASPDLKTVQCASCKKEAQIPERQLVPPGWRYHFDTHRVRCGGCVARNINPIISGKPAWRKKQ